MKVAVLGAAGGIGQALALLLKTQLPSGSELSLYDIAPVTPGVAVDLSHIPTADCQNLPAGLHRHYHQPGEYHRGYRRRSTEKSRRVR